MALELPFDNSFVRELPADPESRNFVRAVQRAAYSRVDPTPVSAPELLAWSPEVARLVGLPEDFEAASALADVFAGNRLLPGMEPYAACYGGHQFGNWAQQLGDGRAITLGEVATKGERWELQLKGAGPTPYSRAGDGRAVLRSSIREFLCSEAMHHLGVPTSRALSLVGTGDAVVRDMFYDGHPKPEPGAIVCRVAPSFLRFGNFELPTARDDKDTLRKLVDYAIETHFPELARAHADLPARIGAWFSEICTRTGVMIAEWMRVGFVHGVMNTDNMSILGLTIDYGPYGWIDDFDPDWTPNTTDAMQRRYRFGNQARIAVWNLIKFATALHPLVGDAAVFEDGVRRFSDAYDGATLKTFAAKLGIESIDPDDDLEDPNSGVGLATGALGVLRSVPTDMTIFWRRLADVPLEREDASEDELLAALAPAYYEHDLETLPASTRAQTLAWLRALGQRVRHEGVAPDTRRARMRRASPKYVLRNYMAQEAIDLAEAGDPSRVHELLDLLRRPYDEQPEREAFAAKRPEWAKNRPGCSMLSCSS